MPKNKKVRYVCQRCALSAPTCCRLGAPGEGYSSGDCFPLSRGEYKRIQAAVEAAASKGSNPGAALLLKTAAKAADAASGAAGWAAKEANSPAFVQAMCNLFPREDKLVKEVFPPGGIHLRLSLRPDGGCAFLSEYGCALPRQARPWFCRLFPFWVVAGRVQCFQDENCLAVRENGDNFIAIMGAFDTSAPDLLDHYTRLRDDWGV